MKKKVLSLFLMVSILLSMNIGVFAEEMDFGKTSDDSMNNYFVDQEYDLYTSGVYQGMVKFKKGGIDFTKIDPKTREQYKRNELGRNSVDRMEIQDLYEELDHFANTRWDKDQVSTGNGKKFNKYITYTGQVGKKQVTSQLWARRDLGDENNIDVITVDNEVVAFIQTGRYSMDILVKRGFENVTPLTKYQDPLLSKAENGIIPSGLIYITMSDGVKLGTNVYLPTSTKQGEKVPAIIVRTPYGKEGNARNLLHLVNRGYALVVQDVRGLGDSEGELLVYQNEKNDGNDLIDWVAGQQWCDGNVGAFGASYLGYTANAMATTGNPNLKTVISEVCVGSPFKDISRRNGTIASWGSMSWLMAQSVSNRVDFSIFSGQSIDPYAVCSSRPLGEIPQKFIGKDIPSWSEWENHYYYDEFWEKSDTTMNAKNIKVPMLLISGWHDDDNLGTQELWHALKENNVEGAKMVLGPWPHTSNDWRACNGVEFGDNAIDYDFDTRIIRWFDRYLKGIENGEDKKPKVTYYLEGENQWKTSDDWMPEEAVLTNLYLGDKASGKLPDKTSFRSYVYDPENPIGLMGGFELPVCNEVQDREDCLVYDTDVLTEDVAVAGDFYAEIYASSSAKDTDFIVRVSDVDENGVTRGISSSVMRAEFRKGLKNPELLTPEKIEKFEFIMNFNGYVFKAGHKIRVDISSSNFVEFFPNTNTGINPYENPEPIKATQKIYSGNEYPSHVKIPVLYGAF